MAENSPGEKDMSTPAHQVLTDNPVITPPESSDEKVNEQQLEHQKKLNTDEAPVTITAKTWTVVFILSMGYCSLCQYGLSFWPISVMAAIGSESEIGTEVGQPESYIWYIPAWTLSITISFMLAGANTDLFGRRPFLVYGNLICFVGQLVIGTAKGKSSVIAGMAVTGFGAAWCQMAAFALSELLPNKWRHIGVVIADWPTFVATFIAPITGRYGNHDGNWRWNFYACAIMQGISFILLYLTYYPPAHPLNISYRQAFREVDYIGAFLFVAGALPALMGMVWAAQYSSSDPHVVAPLVVGFFILIGFALWETFGPLKHPLRPPHMFSSSKGRDFTAPAIALGVINMFYYCSSILWPNMIVDFWSDEGADWKYVSVLSLVQGLAITFGGCLLTIFGGIIHYWHIQLSVSVGIMVTFGALTSLVTPGNKGMMIAFMFISVTSYGWAIFSRKLMNVNK